MLAPLAFLGSTPAQMPTEGGEIRYATNSRTSSADG